MSNKIDYIKNVIAEKNEIKSSIKNITNNNSTIISSQFDEISQLSGNDYSQFDQEMDLSYH